MKRFLIPTAIVGASLFASAAFANTGGEEYQVAGKPSGFTCEEAKALKFNQAKYEALSINEQLLVDGQYMDCKLAAEAEASGQAPDQQVVYISNGDSKMFYGLVRAKDIDNAQKNCAGGGAYTGMAVQMAGSATVDPVLNTVGAGMQQYSNVACAGLADAFRKDNALAFLAPQQVMQIAVQQQMMTDVVRNLPLSDADKRKLEEEIKKKTRVELSHDHYQVGPIKGDLPF